MFFIQHFPLHIKFLIKFLTNFEHNKHNTGPYKAHYATGPGLGGCDNCKKLCYPEIPLIFNVEVDPQEAFPLTNNATPKDPELAQLVKDLNAAYDQEQATFTWGNLTTPPAQPDELESTFVLFCGVFCVFLALLFWL